MRLTTFGKTCIGRLLAFLLVFQYGVAQCDRLVRRPGYSVCVPRAWRVDFEESPDSQRTNICKPSEGRCSKNKDIYPFPGALLVDLETADGRYDWMSPAAVVTRARRLSQPTPSITNITLEGNPSVKRTCWVARSLLYGDLWQETYGLIIGAHRFMVRVLYNNEPENIEYFRSALIELLSSVTTTSLTDP